MNHSGFQHTSLYNYAELENELISSESHHLLKHHESSKGNIQLKTVDKTQ